jgi:hypothetical protein
MDEIAKKFLDRLLVELEAGGSHYAPDLRDAIADHREWLEDQISDLIEASVEEYR